VREQFWAQAPAHAVKAVREAPALGWLPAEHPLGLRAALIAVAGEAEAEELLRGVVLRAVEFPWLNALIQGLSRMFGMNPDRVSRLYVRLWSAISRDAGVFEDLDSGPRHAALLYRDAPPELVRDVPLTVIQRAGIKAALDFTQVVDDPEVRSTFVPEGTRFDIRWELR